MNWVFKILIIFAISVILFLSLPNIFYAYEPNRSIDGKPIGFLLSKNKDIKKIIPNIIISIIFGIILPGLLIFSDNLRENYRRMKEEEEKYKKK